MTNNDNVKKHKLHKINRNIRYFSKNDEEVVLDIFIISSQEQND